MKDKSKKSTYSTTFGVDPNIFARVYRHMRRNPAKNKGFPSGKPLFFSGCSGRDRTCDQVINSHLLYR